MPGPTTWKIRFCPPRPPTAAWPSPIRPWRRRATPTTAPANPTHDPNGGLNSQPVLPLGFQPAVRSQRQRRVRPLGPLRRLATGLQGARSWSSPCRARPSAIRSPASSRSRPSCSRRRPVPIRSSTTPAPRSPSTRRWSSPPARLSSPRTRRSSCRTRAVRCRCWAARHRPRRSTSRPTTTPASAAHRTTIRTPLPAGRLGRHRLPQLRRDDHGQPGTVPRGRRHAGDQRACHLRRATTGCRSSTTRSSSTAAARFPRAASNFYSAITLYNARPAITNDKIANNGGTGGLEAAIGADMDSFREDDKAWGPLIRRTSVANNSLNGIWLLAESNGFIEPTNAVPLPDNPTTLGGSQNYTFFEPLPFDRSGPDRGRPGNWRSTRGGPPIPSPDRLYIQPGVMMKFSQGAGLDRPQPRRQPQRRLPVLHQRLRSGPQATVRPRHPRLRGRERQRSAGALHVDLRRRRRPRPSCPRRST